jgi:hypothetical protein
MTIDDLLEVISPPQIIEIYMGGPGPWSSRHPKELAVDAGLTVVEFRGNAMQVTGDCSALPSYMTLRAEWPPWAHSS